MIMSRVLHCRTGTRRTNNFPCLLHNNLSFKIIMEQTRKSGAESCASFSWQHPYYEKIYFDHYLHPNHILTIYFAHMMFG